MRVRDVIEKMGARPHFAVSSACTLEEAAARVRRAGHVRGIYLEDADGKLEGYVSLGVLIRHVLDSRLKPHFHSRSILNRITARTVADIMETALISARRDEEVEHVLERMLRRNLKEIPVLEDDGRIAAVLGILDLWSAYDT